MRLADNNQRLDDRVLECNEVNKTFNEFNAMM